MISVIIPTFNKPTLLEDCLKSLFTYAPKNIEVIIVDNGSKDILLSNLLEEVIYLKFPKNIGFAAACNAGAKVASKDFLLFLNNDTIAKNDFITPMLKAFSIGTGVVGSKLTYPNGEIQHAGIEFIKTADGVLEGQNIRVERPAGYVGAVTGACMAVRKFVFNEAGGFDEEYWNGNEDVDFCLKAQRNNWRIYYEPLSTLVHLESQSGPERWSNVHKNVEILNRKWNGPHSAI